MESNLVEVSAVVLVMLFQRLCFPNLRPTDDCLALKDVHALYELLPDYRFGEMECEKNLSSWQSVDWFFCRPWFSRLWVFQEVNSGPNVFLMCGSYLFDWDAVALTAWYFDAFHKE